MGFWSVLLAALAAFAAVSGWYWTLSRRWVAATGRSPAELKAAGTALPMVLALAGYGLVAGMMRHALAMAGITGFFPALVAGFGIGLFVVAPFIVTNYAFARQPRGLWWIDAGHAVLACTVVGAVLGLAG